MPAEIISYRCLLTFRPLTGEQVRAARRAVVDSGLEIEVGAEWIKFRYSGRDAGREILKLLACFAEIVVNARGEVSCQIDREHKDPAFEFYTIKKGRLFRQRGRIVRGEIEEV